MGIGLAAARDALGSDRPPDGHSLPRASIPFIIKDQQKRGVRCTPLFCWCGRRELNPYDSHHTPLKRARLPVPPLPRAVAIATTSFIILFFRDLSTPFLKNISFFLFFPKYQRFFTQNPRFFLPPLAKCPKVCYNILVMNFDGGLYAYF